MRDLGLVGLPNARDLGGYQNTEGEVVQSGRLFRSDAPVRATEGDLAALNALGITTVIDLRGDPEIEMFGTVTWDAPRVHLPVSDAAAQIVGMVRNATPENPVTGEDAERLMTEMYREFVTDEQARAQFARALKLIEAEDSLPLLFHCTAGKDRTGWLSALVLSALGVQRSVVEADYLLTNERFTTGRAAAGRQQLLESLGQIVANVEDLMPVLEARMTYLEAAFDEVERHYGDVETFLREGLNADVDALRANLLV